MDGFMSIDIGDKTSLWVNMFWNYILPIKIDLNNYFYVFFISIIIIFKRKLYHMFKVSICMT